MTQAKLVSANMGIVLVVEKNGKQERKEFSIASSKFHKQPTTMLGYLCQAINDELGTDLFVSWDEKCEVEIARPAKIKARKTLTQNQFNEKIKELVP